MTDIHPISRAELSAASAFDQRVDRPVNTTFDADFFQWQYCQTGGIPRSDSTAMAAWVDGQIAATSMMSEMPVWIQDDLYAGGFLHEWYSDPASGFAGLEMIGQQIKRLPMIIGAGPSLVSMLTFKRIRQLQVLPLQRLILPVDATLTAGLSFEQHPHLLPYLQSIRPRPKQAPVLKLLDRFDEHYDRVWENDFRPLCQITANRSADYLNWRYGQHPRFSYQRAVVETASGQAYFVWRVETPLYPETDSRPDQQVQTLPPVRVVRLCEAIGALDAIAAAVPSLVLHWQQQPDIAFADFFCSHEQVCAALIAGGFSYGLVMPGLDLPRLFSPLQNDIRKTLYFYLSYARDLPLSPRFEPGRCYLTKGDSNQDRPNP